MGYSRDTFNPETYIKRGQSTKEMHLSCLCVLSEITPKLTGCESFSLIRPSPTGPTEFSYIDPAGIVMMEKSQGHVCNIQVPAKMTDKVVKRKIGKEKNPAAGQTSIMDASITPEQRERLGRPSNVKGSSSGRGDTRRVSWNANTYIDKGEKGTARAKPRKRWKKYVKMHETVSVAGNATIMEDSPYCGRVCGTGYAQVIFTHGRPQFLFLR